MHFHLVRYTDAIYNRSKYNLMISAVSNHYPYRYKLDILTAITLIPRSNDSIIVYPIIPPRENIGIYMAIRITATRHPTHRIRAGSSIVPIRLMAYSSS